MPKEIRDNASSKIQDVANSDTVNNLIKKAYERGHGNATTGSGIGGLVGGIGGSFLGPAGAAVGAAAGAAIGHFLGNEKDKS